MANEPGRRHGFDEDEVAVECQVLDDLSREEVCDACSHFGFGEDNVVRSNTAEDSSVRLGECLGPDVWDFKVGQRGGCQHACFDICADTDGNGDCIGDPQLLECLRARRVGLGDMGQHATQLLDSFAIGVDSEHFVAHVDERRRECAAEAAEADDNEFAGVFDVAVEPAKHRMEQFVSQ